MNRLLMLGLLLLLGFGPVCRQSPQGEVVVYIALDEGFADPILKDFQKETGIRVKPQWDTEASKTVGLVYRLLAERDHPQADVFWNNEIGWMLDLKREGLLAPYVAASAADIPARYKDPEGYWTGFAARARVILYNTNLLKESEAPQSLSDLVKPVYRGKVALANPLIGTNLTQAAALFAALGPERAKQFYRDLRANDCRIVDGNLIAAMSVANGEIPIGLTDTDDANEMLLDKKPVKIIYPDQAGAGTLVLPNSVGLIKGGPNPQNAKRFIEYLLSKQTEQKLAKIPSAQMPVRPGLVPYSPLFDLAKIKELAIDYRALAKWLTPAKEFIHREFMKQTPALKGAPPGS